MSAPRRGFRRLFSLDLGRRAARDVDDELEFHLATRAQRLSALGLTPEQAQAEALRQFGDVARVRDDCVTIDEERNRTMRRLDLLDQLRQDIVFALRTLRRNPAMTAVVGLSLALGIGANTTIFTLVDAVMLRQLPVTAPSELVAIGNPARVSSHSTGSGRVDLLSLPLYRDIRDQDRLMSGVLASGRAGRVDVRVGATGGDFEHPRARFVSANYFRVLGVRAQQGAAFDGTEDRAAGAAPVAVISDEWWHHRFDGDPGIVGKTITADGARLTIIGVAPPGFTGEIVGVDNELWIPISMQPVMQPHQADIEQRGTSWLLLLGRVRPGTTIPQLHAELTGIMRRSMGANLTPGDPPNAYANVEPLVSPGARGLSGLRAAYSAPLATLMAAVGLLMLIICANVANLLLARAVARNREMGVRLAIGAGRGRLVRQLVTESAVLALLGATMGLALAWGGSRLVLMLTANGGAAIPLDVRPDLPVLGFTLALGLASVGLFGLVPALRASRVDLARTMQAQGRGVSGGLGARGGRFGAGKALVAAQMALSVVLLAGAAVLVKNLRDVENASPGLDRDHLVLVELDALDRNYHGVKLEQLTRDLTDRFSKVPGVAGVAYSANGLFNGNDGTAVATIPGFTPRTRADATMHLDFIGPGYVQAIGARLITGRDIDAQDVVNGRSVMLVNESLARFYFGSTDVVGRTIEFTANVPTTIVGVVADIRDRSLTDPPVRRAYGAFAQQLDSITNEPDALVFEVRTVRDPAAVVDQLRRAVASVDPLLPIASLSPLTARMRASVGSERLLSRLTTAFGVLALLLASIGLYGVMTYAVSRRTGEIGLRMALGAARGDIARMVVRDSLLVVLSGVAAGIPLAVASFRLLKATLNGVSAGDPWSVGIAIGVLALAAIISALIPAWRASRVEPVVALRAE